jgi:hypothetical protein
LFIIRDFIEISFLSLCIESAAILKQKLKVAVAQSEARKGSESDDQFELEVFELRNSHRSVFVKVTVHQNSIIFFIKNDDIVVGKRGQLPVRIPSKVVLTGANRAMLFVLRA